MKNNNHRQGIELLIHPPSPSLSPLLPPLSSLLCQPFSPSPRHSLPSPMSLLEPQFSPCSPPILSQPSTPLPRLLLSSPIKRSCSNLSFRDRLGPDKQQPLPKATVKRKRGRPPNSISSLSHFNGWTFVTPTVCSVKQKQREMSNDRMALQWPTCKNESEHGGINTFINTKMDIPLSMPNKKRGRKPKVQMKGNFCFIWRDLTARRKTRAN